MLRGLDQLGDGVSASSSSVILACFLIWLEDGCRIPGLAVLDA